MLLNLQKQSWTAGLGLQDFEHHKKGNEESVKVRARRARRRR